MVFFDWDSVAITPRMAAILNNAAHLLVTNPACPVVIKGYADRSGSADYNMALSKRRAEAVRTYLRRHGVGTKLAVVAFGETHPLVETPNGAREPQNRHAEIWIGLNP